MEKEFEVNQKIRELRKARGLSQDYMAKELGISQKAYSKIECNETHLSFDRITKIARLLGLTSWQIIALDVPVILGKQPARCLVVGKIDIFYLF
jgi:transcriptional regulator with XRE-family HTH domain